jgi:signal transduction histidine kinase
VEEKNLLGCLAKASQAAQEAAHMSSQLLTFSKGGSPVKKIVRMSELLVKSAHFSLHGSNLRAEMDIPPDLWPTEVDPTQIEQVINALMINAREATPSGGTVDISARNVKLDDKPGALLPGGRYIKVAIADHGSGVPVDIATKIFDPYFTHQTGEQRIGTLDKFFYC